MRLRSERRFIRRDVRYVNALEAAAAGKDNEQIVQLLLNSGANVNMQLSSGGYGSALVAATAGGNEHIVQQLLNSGADVNMQPSCGRYGSALAVAAAEGYIFIVQLLLNSGA